MEKTQGGGGGAVVVPEYVVKIPVLGAASVGKTALIQRYLSMLSASAASSSSSSTAATTASTSSAFSTSSSSSPSSAARMAAMTGGQPTVGMDLRYASGLGVQQFEHEKKPFATRLAFWDCSAAFFETNFADVMDGAAGLVLVFSVADASSMQAIDRIVHLVKHLPRIPTVLIVNFSDVSPKAADTVVVPSAAVLDTYTRQHLLLGWFLTSGKTGKNVKEAFDALVQNVYDRMQKLGPPRVPKLRTQDLRLGDCIWQEDVELCTKSMIVLAPGKV
eukprot:ANDGO_07353.mRNA.1 small GTPase